MTGEEPYIDVWWDEDGIHAAAFQAWQYRDFLNHRPSGLFLLRNIKNELAEHQRFWFWRNLPYSIPRAQLLLALAAAGIKLDLPDALWRE